MLLVAFGLAYFLSTYITKSLKTISDKLGETSLNQKNEKIGVEASSKEINLLIKSYNAMVDELEISAVKLAQSEREEARNGQTGRPRDQKSANPYAFDCAKFPTQI
jgi:two-component system, NtrC family, nitrogen regulation sensor histidine kinase NtrY